MSTLLFLVILSSIMILFSKETTALFKKYYEIGWLRVSVPFVILSWLWIWNDSWIQWLLAWLQTQIVGMILKPTSLLPQRIQWIMEVFIFYILASMPAWLLYFWQRWQGLVVPHTQKALVTKIYLFSWVALTVLVLS